MRILLVAATVLSCACANAAQNLPPLQGSPAPPANSISKGSNRPNGSLKSVKSERALRRLLADVDRQREALRKREQEENKKQCLEWSKGLPGPVNCDNGMLAETVTVSGMAMHEEMDTNTQHDGVDEGGLVKKIGDILVVLRRGRLFTIDTSGAQLAAVDMANLAPAAPPGGQPDWYDEMLIAGRTVIVIGYSNSREGTEIVLFDLRERGRLEYRATYNLRSEDYYSGENYASRLVNGKLILYTTRPLPDEAKTLEWMPAMRQWESSGTPQDFKRIAQFDRVFTPAAPLGAFPTVHTMVTCDPSALEFTCDGTVILTDYLSVYYASPSAAYAWTHSYNGYTEMQRRPLLYRVPFDGSPITALQVTGEPDNQFAFLESEDAHLNVVVRQEGTDDAVTALLRVPLATFADGSTAAPPESYRQLTSGMEFLSARFVGESVLVGGASASLSKMPLVVARWRSPQIFKLPLQHHVERIEALGNDAIVIGQDGDRLGMTTIDLSAQPVAAGSLRVERAQQAESRSHGFLYRAESARDGMFGLPLLLTTPTVESAAVVFIRNNNLALQPAGSLTTTEMEEPDDNCVVSCVDWYGNARAIFSGPRVFALMGYELVEGRIDANGQIAEANRLNFNPAIEKSKQ
jgi:hypothetical protein